MSDPCEQMHDRLNAAEDLVAQGKHDEAMGEFVWLWDNIEVVCPSMSGVRQSFMAAKIAELVKVHPPARRRFEEIRERTGNLADAVDVKTAGQRWDWIVLNKILADEERTVAWFDGVKDDARYGGALDSLSDQLVPLLEARERFRDIGRLQKDPVRRFVRRHESMQPPPGFNPEIRGLPAGAPTNIGEMLLERLAQGCREHAALMVTSLRAAQRGAEADAIEREALRLDPSDAMRSALRKTAAKPA